MFDMQPQPDDTTISLPITFDYSGGRADNARHKWFQVALVVVLAIFISVMVFMADVEFWKRFLVFAGIVFIAQFLIRFGIMKETLYSDSYERLKEVDFIPSTNNFWKIYEVDDQYPYIAHFKNGIKGVFVRLEKDVVVGKPDTVMYDHYEAISNAYNIAGSNNISMMQLDYMDNVGNDPRLREMYAELNQCRNEEMRDIMLNLYAHLQEEMSLNFACYDVYLFYTKGKESQLWYITQLILSEMLSGNYLAYKVMDLEGIRQACMATFNLEEFSAVEACDAAFDDLIFNGIIPISLQSANGEYTKLGKTQAEIRQEILERQERERIEHERKANMTVKERLGINKNKGAELTKDTEIDIFDDTPDLPPQEEYESFSDDDFEVKEKPIRVLIRGNTNLMMKVDIVSDNEDEIDIFTDDEPDEGYYTEDNEDEIDIFTDDEETTEEDTDKPKDEESEDEEVDIFAEDEEDEIDIFAD